MAKSNIVRITVLEPFEDGWIARDLMGPRKKKKKDKRARWARGPERLRRRRIAARAAYWAAMEALHDKSNDKKRYGSLRDRPKNTAKALRKAVKAMRRQDS